jgi:MFS family permease
MVSAVAIDNVELLDKTLQLTLLFVSIVLDGVARSFFSPSYFGLQGEVIAKADLSDASSLLGGSRQAAAVVGPALGGLLYGIIGPVGTFGISIILCAIGVYLMRYIPAAPKPVHPERLVMKASITEGIKFVFSQPILLGALSLDLFAVLFGGAVALLPAMAKQILAVGPEGLGILRAAPALGAVTTAFLLINWPIRAMAGKTLLFSVAGCGLSMVCFGLSNNFWLSLACLVVSGSMDHISVVIRSTIMQTFTPQAMRGRIAAVESIFITSSNEIGAFESGITASWLGIQRSIVLGGILSIAITGWISLQLAPLRKLDKMEP